MNGKWVWGAAFVWAWAAILTVIGQEPEPVDVLITAGKYEQALGEVRRLRASLPGTERLTAWELEFHGLVSRVVPGRECLYYLLHSPNSREDARLQDALNSVSANRSSSNWKFAVVCVSLSTGQIRWSRLVNGLVCLAVDPQNDDLYLFRQHVVVVSSGAGEIKEQQDNLATEKELIHGLLFGGHLALSWPYYEPNRTRADARILVYDPKTRSTRHVNAADYRLLAPDERYRLMPIQDGWDCVGVGDGQKQWSLRAAPFAGDCPPLWIGGNPVFITGTEGQRGTVRLIDVATGVPKWSTALGWGAYEARQHQLQGNEYQADNWTPLTALDEHLLALDGSGRLYFLDPANGKIEAARRLGRNYLAMPFQRGTQLLVPFHSGIRSYSMAGLMHPEDSSDVQLCLKEARCLLELKRPEEALAVLDRLVDRAPDVVAGWTARAQVCAAMKNAGEESFSRVEAMVHSGQTSDESPRKQLGLLRVYDMGSAPCKSVVEMEGHIHVGTLDGTLWRARTTDLQFSQAARLDHEIIGLTSRVELQAVLGNPSHSLSPVPRTPPPTPAARIQWYSNGMSQPVDRAVWYEGRQVQPAKGGGVRVLTGTEMVDLPPRMEGLEDWQIHVSPAGVLGYGEGVFELDETLRPVRWLIRPQKRGRQDGHTRVVFVRMTTETIGLVVADYSSREAEVKLQVFNRDGVLLNELSLGPHVTGWPDPLQLMVLGDGYLFCDRQMTWVGPAKGRIWRFGPPHAHCVRYWGDRFRFFGNPLLANGCLWVTSLDGRLYVFEASQLTKSTTP